MPHGQKQRRPDVLEMIAFALFYGIMALVAATCFIELGSMTALGKPDWFSAWGSWVSGLGTFVAAGVALWVSGRDRRDRKAESDQEMRFKRHFAAYHLLLFTEELREKLETINIGSGVDEVSWLTIRATENKVPEINAEIKVSNIPGVMYLGTLCEDGMDIERRLRGHNAVCRYVNSQLRTESKFDIFQPMRNALEEMHSGAAELGLELVDVLGPIYDSPDYEAWRRTTE